MASKDIPLSELLMQEPPDAIVDLTSPLNSVDATSKDRVVIQEELEKRLKQRVGRQDLVERNILPPLSFPTASKLFTNSQQLHRAQIADNLQKKMRNRPGRDNLMQMNILPDLNSHIDPALQATQLQLKKSKLADTLNDKLANRPGPLQLLQDGIIEPHLSEVVKGVELNPPLQELSSKASPSTSTGGTGGTEKAGFAPIPEISFHTAQQQRAMLSRHSIAGASPSTERVMDTSPGQGSSFSTGDRKLSDSSISPAPSPLAEEARSPEKVSRDFTITYPPLVKANYSGLIKSASSSSMPRKKTQKKYRKLRYHEYVPPSKSTPKGGKTTPKPPANSDSPYSSLLQQQQLFLQLQVLQKQYPNGVLMHKLPEMINSMTKDQKALAVAAAKGRLSVTSPSDLTLGKQATLPQVLPVELPNKHNTSSVRFEDLKVNDLKTACKELGMIVSGKKAELVERLLDHNKGILPASSLPEHLSKDNRRQTFSLGQGSSSIDSQLSISPTSPNSSPVFKFPSDQGGHDSGATKQSSRVQLAEVFPATSLNKDIVNEMFERQKRNYICQKGVSEKSIAPRPELNELLAIKLPPQAYPTASTASSMLDQQKSGKLGTAKSPRSLPASPRTDSSPGGGASVVSGLTTPGSDLMDSCEMERVPSLPSSTMSSTSVCDTGMGQLHSLGSISTAAAASVGGGGGSLQSIISAGGTYTTSYYHPQTTSAQKPRPVRSSVPIPSGHVSNAGAPTVVEPPSYSSVMRSRSIAGAHPSLTGLAGLNNGVNFNPTGLATPPNELAGKPLNSDLFGPEPVDMPMDTGESTSISDIFDILRAEGEEFGPSQPMSLPAGALSGPTHPSQRPHGSLPQTPRYSAHHAPKLSTNLSHDSASQSSSYMLGNIMPFGNPSLTAHNKSGSDVCLNVDGSGGREGQKNSLGGSGMYGTGMASNTLGNELNWLDLDHTNSLGMSPTMQSGLGFGALNSHSNPGSLPHEQFQNAFMDDGMVSQVGVMGTPGKGSNPAMNGFGLGGVSSGVAGMGGGSGFLETGIIQQAGLYPTSEEQRLLELGLST